MGDVKVKKSGSWQSAAQSMDLTRGDEIKTGDKSTCNLSIGNESFITLKSDSHLVIEDLFKDVSGVESNSFELKMGRSIVNPKKLLKGDSFQIRTPQPWPPSAGRSS